MLVGFLEGDIADRGRAEGRGAANDRLVFPFIQHYCRVSERVGLENINILMSRSGSGSIILEDMVHFSFGLIHQMSFKQPLV